jgi:hypothetical protein
LMAHSSVVTGTSGMEDSISYELPGTEWTEFLSMKRMIASMHKIAQQSEKDVTQTKEVLMAMWTQLSILQAVNNEYRWQVHHLSKNYRILSEQVLSLCSAMETLSTASLCDD